MTHKNGIDDLITVISSASDRYGDKLLDFMMQYNLLSLSEAQRWQLQEYVNTEMEVHHENN